MEGRLEVLFLVRHGKAVGAHPDGDRQRALSTEGLRRIATLVPRAQSMGFRGDLAISSPYLRAVQTRDHFFAAFGATRAETSPVFTPEADPRDAIDELKVWEAAGYRRVAVFTHNPFVTDLADRLLVPGALRDLGEDLVFHTPTILALGFEAGLAPRQGRPLWMLHP